jgi:hypothetical protein
MPQWAGIISLVVGFGRPAGARFLVYSVDALLWVLGVALIIATARLWAFFELRHRSRQAAAELSTRMEPRYDDRVSTVDGSATVIGDTRPYRLDTDRPRGPERGRTPQAQT